MIGAGSFTGGRMGGGAMKYDQVIFFPREKVHHGSCCSLLCNEDDDLEMLWGDRPPSAFLLLSCRESFLEQTILVAAHYKRRGIEQFARFEREDYYYSGDSTIYLYQRVFNE